MEEEIWTVGRILEWIEGYLGQHGDAAPKASAEWLVSDALDLTRMGLFLERDRPLSLEERDVLRGYTRRRAAGEPLQYITGTTGFRYIKVKVRPGVLIPRPETEVLVSEALSFLSPSGKGRLSSDDLGLLAAELVQSEEGLGFDEAFERVKADYASERAELLVADICTGSGCIACSMATEHAGVRVVATDLSPEAVALARENAQALGVADRVQVVECDLGAGIDEALVGSFDVVVSNPPYVPTDVLSSIPREVADFEPALALDGGPDGLDVFRRLVDWARKALKPGGGFACELHETCLADAAAEAEYAGFTDVRVVPDLAGRSRVLACRKRQ